MYIFCGKRSKIFAKCNEIWENVSNIIKKNIYICAHNKKYLKAEKNQQKRRLSM